MKSLRYFCVAAALWFACGDGRSALGCGPYYPEVAFSHILRPDFPLEDFAGGNLGVLQPTYARSYLYTAYRHLTGKPLTSDEEKGITDLWSHRSGYLAKPPGEDPIQVWIRARRKVLSTDVNAESIGPFKHVSPYVWFMNCTGYAMEGAARTLENRIRRLGVSSPVVRDWVRAQDQVFTNCAGGPVIPAAPAVGSDPLVRADRLYQIAAAHFYAGQYDQAEARFEEIARDPASPWRAIAPYLVARTLVRRASLTDRADKSLEKAQRRLETILKDPSLSAVHDDAREYLDLVHARLNPEGRYRELSRILALGNRGRSIRRELDDYTRLQDRVAESEISTLVDAARGDPIADWIFTFQRNSHEAFEHSLAMWKQTQAPHWLVTSLAKVTGRHISVSQLLEAAARITSDSPGYETAHFHAARLLIELGRVDQARERIDALLGREGGSTPSATNLFRALRMKTASNLDDFLNYAQRKPVAIDGNPDRIPATMKDWLGRRTEDRVVFLDSDGARMMSERFPAALLRQAAAGAILAPHLRQEVVRAVWVRSVILRDESAAIEMAGLLQDLVPELKSSMQDYMAASEGDARHFLAIQTLLHFPGLNPYVGAGFDRSTPLGRLDHLRENWWCRIPDRRAYGHYERRTRMAGPLEKLYPEGKIESPLFLDESSRSVAQRELEQLAAAGVGPTYVGREVLEWAKRRPRDPRLPEALHRVVLTTRFSCPDQDNGKVSKAAFKLLHGRWPRSPWARKTPLWFDSY